MARRSSQYRPSHARLRRTPAACDEADKTSLLTSHTTPAGVGADTGSKPPVRGVPSTDPNPPSFARKHVPGPTPLPIVGNALDILKCPLSELMLQYARSHGPVVKFAIVSDVMHLISDPSALQYMHATNSRNYLDRWTPPGFGPLLYDGRLRGLVFSQGRYWMQHRHLVSTAFRSRAFLAHFVSVASSHSRFLIDDVWRAADSKTTIQVNIYEALRMLTLDVIGKAAFNASFNAMSKGSHPIETSLGVILHGVLDVIKSPIPLWRIMRTPGRAIVDANLQQLQKIEMDLIHERRASLQQEEAAAAAAVAAGEESPLPANDLLAKLLRARDSHKEVHFEDEDLMWDVHDVIFAGHETTASALSAAVWLIAGSPRVRKKVVAELDAVLPDDRAPEVSDLTQLGYLDMVFNEALRLYPPTALVGRISKEDDVIAGYAIPAGSNVLISPYVMGRLPELWGDDVEEFRPERFDSAQSAVRHPMTHTPFGAGPRVCLGARMATLQAKVVLATLFKYVEFERVDDELVVDYDSTVSFKSGMDMRIRKRVI